VPRPCTVTSGDSVFFHRSDPMRSIQAASGRSVHDRIGVLLTLSLFPSSTDVANGPVQRRSRAQSPSYSTSLVVPYPPPFYSLFSRLSRLACRLSPFSSRRSYHVTRFFKMKSLHSFVLNLLRPSFRHKALLKLHHSPGFQR